MRNARDLEKSLQNEQKKLQDEQKKLAELQSHKGDGTAEEVELPAAAEAQKGLSLGFLWGWNDRKKDDRKKITRLKSGICLKMDIHHFNGTMTFPTSGVSRHGVTPTHKTQNQPGG